MFSWPGADGNVAREAISEGENKEKFYYCKG